MIGIQQIKLIHWLSICKSDTDCSALKILARLNSQALNWVGLIVSTLNWNHKVRVSLVLICKRITRETHPVDTHTHTRRKLTYYSVFASMNQLLSWFHAPGPDLKLTPGAKRTWWSIQAWEVSSSMLSGFVKSGKMPELYNTSCKPEAPASPVQKESL